MTEAALVLGVAVSLPLAAGRIIELFVQARLQRRADADKLSAVTLVLENVEAAFLRGVGALHGPESQEKPN